MPLVSLQGVNIGSSVFEMLIDREIVPCYEAYGVPQELWLHQHDSCGGWNSAAVKRHALLRGLTCIKHPAQSPDCNPQEFMWSKMDHYLYNVCRPTCVAEFRDRLSDAFDRSTTYDNLVSYVARWKSNLANIEARNGNNNY